MKKQQEREYPISLFWMGFLMNLTKNFLLFFPGIIFLIIGIWVEWCLIVGMILIAVDILVSLIEQILIRNTTLNSDNPNFKEWQEAILSPEWKENVGNLTESKIGNSDSDEN